MKGEVIYEFVDGNNNTYAVIDWGKYREVALILVNVNLKEENEKLKEFMKKVKEIEEEETEKLLERNRNDNGY